MRKSSPKIVGFNANSLYLYCFGQEMPCSKEEYVEVDQPYDMEELRNQVMKGMLFGFLQVDIYVLNELIDKFSRFCPLFVVDSIPDELISSHVRVYQMRTGQKRFVESKKLLGVTCAEKILLYLPMLKWYLELFVSISSTAVHKYLKYESGWPFNWFAEEVSKARHNRDINSALKRLNDTQKLKGNLFYGKMIEDPMKHLK